MYKLELNSNMDYTVNIKSLLFVFVLNLWREEVFDVANVLNIILDNEGHLGRQGQDHLGGEGSRLGEEIQISKLD